MTHQNITRAALLAALSLAAFTASAGCNVNRATGERMCIYGGAEVGWAANLTFRTNAGQPFLVVTSLADDIRITPDAVVMRPDGGAPVKVPVYGKTSATNCSLGARLFGACMPTTTAVVKLDRETMVRLANTKATYVAATEGTMVGPNVKLKGSQMKAWLRMYDAANPGAASAPVAAAPAPVAVDTTAPTVAPVAPSVAVGVGTVSSQPSGL